MLEVAITGTCIPWYYATYSPFNNEIIPLVSDGADIFGVFGWPGRIGLTHGLRMVAGFTDPDFIGGEYTEVVLDPGSELYFTAVLGGQDITGSHEPLVRAEGCVVLDDEVLNGGVVRGAFRPANLGLRLTTGNQGNRDRGVRLICWQRIQHK